MSTRTDIALRAVRRLAETRRESGAELAAELEVTPSYLARILSPLVRAGWISSKQGPSGGYVIACDPCALSVLEVIEAVEGPVDSGHCVLRDMTCSSASPCSMHDAWARARDALTRELRATAVAECTPGRST